jgi:hypothetical protein
MIDFNRFQRGQGSFDERLQSLRDERYGRYADVQCQVMDYNRLQRAVEKGPLSPRDGCSKNAFFRQGLCILEQIRSCRSASMSELVRRIPMLPPTGPRVLPCGRTF